MNKINSDNCYNRYSSEFVLIGFDMTEDLAKKCGQCIYIDKRKGEVRDFIISDSYQEIFDEDVEDVGIRITAKLAVAKGCTIPIGRQVHYINFISKNILYHKTSLN